MALNSNPDKKTYSSTGSDFKDYWKFMFKYAIKHKFKLLILSFAILIFIIAGRSIPLLFGWAVDFGIKKSDTQVIYYCAYALLVSNALRALLSFYISFEFRKIGQYILFDIRKDLIEHIQKIKISFFDKTPSGKIVTRVANDSKSLGDLFAEGLSGAFINVIEIISILVSLFFISWPMAFVVTIVLPPVLWACWVLSEKIRIQFILTKSKLSSINSFSAENLNGIQVLQLYNGESQIFDVFKENVEDYKRLQLKSVNYFALLWPVVEFFQVFAILLSLIVGFYLTEKNLITIGQIGAFILMLQGFFRPFRFILEKYNQIQNGVTSSQRIIRLFDEETEQNQKQTQAESFIHTNRDPKIEVKNLSFSYLNSKNTQDLVLNNISFEINSGQQCAIVGKTGSGKTTLVSLLQRFYSSPYGSIKIDGLPVEDYKIEDLRSKLLVIRQDEFIFKGDLRSNISIGSRAKSISDFELNKIISQVGLNLSLDLHIDEMGANLSAGEKQLIALARVLVYDPEILILDEATSHIDSISEKKVLSAFEKVLKGRTSIIIAHRLTTVLRSDLVLVLENGKIIEKDRPKSLIENPNSHFRKFYDELM